MPTLHVAGAKHPGAIAEAGGTLVLHSRHYHAALLRTLYEADGIDAASILRGAGLVAGNAWPGALPGAVEVGRGLDATIRQAGLGAVARSSLRADGTGEVGLQASHFARAWTGRYAAAAKPVCAATAGILSSLLSRHYGRPLAVEESACAAAGARTCTFVVSHRDADGLRDDCPPSDLVAANAPASPGDSDGTLIEDLFGAAPAGGEPGAIGGPGGPFVLLPAVFHAALAAGFEREVPRRRGPKFGNLPGILLQEAAHRNGFHLFGEILRSPAWLERVQPRGATGEEKLRLLLRVVGVLGWGSWEVRSFAAGERLIAQSGDSCEAIAHQRLFERAASPRCYVARGATAAIMNLLFREATPGGSELTESDYNRLFRSPASFRAVETRCRAMGDLVCEIVANPLSL